ncbi:TraB/GumN family protein [Halobacterium salinarum]|uniref:TraB/GumN family protein n=1 Tax=Halobacterium salinarum TaxID=2242 RepID=UPI002553F78A|nr:TraB/GumN family protein [Halobacterium salinarum]MDL0138094.1 TraB/GumN family protein [Halobacterium salinarum]
MSEDAASADREGSVRVVGTAHVSSDSVEEVERVIDDEHPDTVAVELDEGRFRQMQGDAPDDLDATDLLKGSMAFQFLAYWLLSYAQRRLGEKFGIEPGADMQAAVDAANTAGADVALVDRDIQVTIQRFWARMSLPEKLRMGGELALGVTDSLTLGLTVGGLIGAFVGVIAELLGGLYVLPSVPPGLGVLAGVVGVIAAITEIGLFAIAGGAVFGIAFTAVLAWTAPDTETDVAEFSMDELTDADVVSAMMAEFRRFSPGGAQALIDERDAFIAHNLLALRAQGKDVVAVVGAGHRDGIMNYLENPDSLPPMESLTGKETGGSWLLKGVGLAFTVGFLVFFALLVMAGVGNDVLLQVFGGWFLFNGVFSLTTAKLAGAHWTSAGVGGAVAWLTSVNPLLAPGWFAGYIELRYLSVHVTDIETLNTLLDDETRPVREIVSEMLDVPLFRLIAVVAMTNVGSIVASVLFPLVVLPAIGGPFDSLHAVSDAMVQGAENSARALWGLL